MNKKISSFLLTVALLVFSSCASAGNYAGTKYPIILVGGGFLEFDYLDPNSLHNMDPFDTLSQGGEVEEDMLRYLKK